MQIADFVEPLAFLDAGWLYALRTLNRTFPSKGKTDIYLNIDKGNILVFECKIWGGPKLYLDTIDQLLGYLTWRHNFAVMITFVRQKNLTKILEQIPELTVKHSSSMGHFSHVGETHFRSKHRLPHDEHKVTQLHHLFYNLYLP